MEKEDIKLFASKLMMNLNDEEVDDIQQEFVKLDKMLSFFDEIDTTNVEEMIYPFEDETSFIRDDEPTHVLSQEDALKNADKVISGHIVVPKVVK